MKILSLVLYLVFVFQVSAFGYTKTHAGLVTLRNCKEPFICDKVTSFAVPNNGILGPMKTDKMLGGCTTKDGVTTGGFNADSYKSMKECPKKLVKLVNAKCYRSANRDKLLFSGISGSHNSWYQYKGYYLTHYGWCKNN